MTPPEQRPQTPSPTSSGAGPATTAPGAASTDGTLPAASPAGPLRLLTASLASDPVLDVALGSALLELIAAGEADATFRIGRPAPTLSFGRLDRILPGFPAAVATARSLGFTATLRVGGGRAAAIHEGALSFGIAQPADDGTTSDRFAWLADVVLAALARVGVRAARGRLPDEYCPGDWSINARGVKLSGLSQRVKRHATWTEGLLLVEGGERAREVLHAVHADLGLPLDPATVGAVEDLVPGIVVADVARALRDELAARGTISDAPIDPLTLARAETLRERHEVG